MITGGGHESAGLALHGHYCTLGVSANVATGSVGPGMDVTRALTVHAVLPCNLEFRPCSLRMVPFTHSPCSLQPPLLTRTTCPSTPASHALAPCLRLPPIGHAHSASRPPPPHALPMLMLQVLLTSVYIIFQFVMVMVGVGQKCEERSVWAKCVAKAGVKLRTKCSGSKSPFQRRAGWEACRCHIYRA